MLIRLETQPPPGHGLLYVYCIINSEQAIPTERGPSLGGNCPVLVTVFQATSFRSEEFSSKYHNQSPTFETEILEPPNNGAYISLHIHPSLSLRRPSSYPTIRCHRHRTALDRSKKTARPKTRYVSPTQQITIQVKADPQV